MTEEQKEIIIDTEKPKKTVAKKSTASTDKKTANCNMNIYQKISEAKKNIGVVKKNGKVEFKSTNYNYQKAEDIELAVREACDKVGLLIVPNSFRIIKDEGNIITTEQSFNVVDIDTGEKITCYMGGQGQDSGDKRIYKAETGAYKYFMKQLFQIPSEDTDPDLIPTGAYDNPKPNQGNGAITWRDYVPKTGKHAGKTLGAIVTTDPSWVKFWANKASEAQPYCVAAMKELNIQ